MSMGFPMYVDVIHKTIMKKEVGERDYMAASSAHYLKHKY